MASQSKPAPPDGFPGDRAAVPAAVEDSSDSAWQRFMALQAGEAEEFERTQVQSTVRQTLDLPEPAPAAAAGQPTLEDTMVLVRRNNRACPLPQPWAEFHRLLPTLPHRGGQLTAPPPLQGAEWAGSSTISKRLRLRDQIDWAARTGTLEAAYRFLAALPEEQWLHIAG